MRLKVWVGVCVILVSSTAIAQEQRKMSHEGQMAMEAMMKAATPGDAQAS